MEELYQMATQLLELLNEQKQKLKNNHTITAHQQSELNNREREILSFKATISEVDPNPFLKNEIIENYKKTYKDIAQRIKMIGKD